MNSPLRIAVLLAAAALPLAASKVADATFAELSQAAHHVVAGEITSISTRQTPGGYIYSKVTLNVADASPRALAGTSYSFEMLGGEHEGQRLYIADFPELHPGDSVVLFLNDNTSQVFGPTVGLWQGVFYIQKAGSPGGKPRVADHKRRPVVEVRGGRVIRGIAPAESASGAPEAAIERRLGLSVADFMDKVRQHRRSD